MTIDDDDDNIIINEMPDAEHNDNDDNIVIAMKDLRERGNFEFRKSNYDIAISLYTSAIDYYVQQEDNNSLLSAVENDQHQQHLLINDEYILNLCNRSACYYQIESYQESYNDSIIACQLSNGISSKATYRYAKSIIQLLKLHSTEVLPGIDDIKMMINQTIQYIDQQINEIQNENDTDNDQFDDLLKQRKALHDMLNQIIKLTSSSTDIEPIVKETSIRYVTRPVSIREFTKGKELGVGNFSEIVVVTHHVTGEKFAIKMIEKKRADELMKRQHPNVYNEIQMERRVLLERLPNRSINEKRHYGIVEMFHAFQDYTTLYYLMELHIEWGDLWSELKYKFPLNSIDDDDKRKKSNYYTMIGCHRNQIKQWMYELIDAIEFIHEHGIVHRDLKPENILLTKSGHILIIDFGTAKDLLYTDLNGPEFVGTPDFMSPEAVSGDSGKPGTDYDDGMPSGAKGKKDEMDEDDNEDPHDKKKKTKKNKGVGASFEADLWALGAILFIMQVGHTPFWCPSPYLAFLKIQRSKACLLRPTGIIDDTCWDIILQLMNYNPNHRIGSNVFKVNRTLQIVLRLNPNGYNIIRDHPYFDTLRTDIRIQQEANRIQGPLVGENNNMKIPLEILPTPVPSLQDIAIRAVAIQAYRDSLNVEVLELNPPGNGNKKHDMTLLDPILRNGVLHVLDRCQLLRTEPRLYPRFCIDHVSARIDIVRFNSKDCIGLTQMNDDQCKAPNQQMNDPYAKPILIEPIKIVQIINPLFTITNENNDDDITRKEWKKLLKKCIATINRKRPKLVFVTAMNHNSILKTNESIRKLFARISETIPVVIHDGSTFFTFWKMGIQCLVLQTSTLPTSSLTTTKRDEDKMEQVAWVRSHLEQSRMAKYPLFVFIDSDPRIHISKRFLKKLARGRTLCLLGLVENEMPSSNTLNATTVTTANATESITIPQDKDAAAAAVASSFDIKIKYIANETLDDTSIRSTDSEEVAHEGFVMQMKGTNQNGLQWITVNPNEADQWSVEFEPID